MDQGRSNDDLINLTDQISECFAQFDHGTSRQHVEHLLACSVIFHNRNGPRLTSFVVVPAFKRVDPVTTSGPEIGEIIISTMSAWDMALG